jgi:hypothetical protein
VRDQTPFLANSASSELSSFIFDVTPSNPGIVFAFGAGHQLILQCSTPLWVMRRFDWQCASYAARLFESAVLNFHVLKKQSRFRELWRSSKFMAKP